VHEEKTLHCIEATLIALFSSLLPPPAILVERNAREFALEVQRAFLVVNGFVQDGVASHSSAYCNRVSSGQMVDMACSLQFELDPSISFGNIFEYETDIRLNNFLG
jgi:hypothetical protein